MGQQKERKKKACLQRGAIFCFGFPPFPLHLMANQPPFDWSPSAVKASSLILLLIFLTFMIQLSHCCALTKRQILLANKYHFVRKLASSAAAAAAATSKM